MRPYSRVLSRNSMPPSSRGCSMRAPRSSASRSANIFPFRRRGDQHVGTRAQSARMGSHPRRLFDRLGRTSCGWRGRHGNRRGPGWLDPHSGFAVRRRRHQADLGSRTLHRHHGDGPDHRPRRTLTATAAENALFLEVMAGEDGYDSRQRGLKLDITQRPSDKTSGVSKSAW